MEAGPVKPYVVGLDLTGRRVVVVGAGTVAGRRLPRLIAAGADVRLIAPDATPAVEAMATAGELRWEVRGYTDGDLESAWYALACSSEPAVNAAVAAEAQRRRVFCVRADDATGGSAVTAATGEHDGLLIGVLAGRRPRRSAAVRDAILDALRTGVVDDAPDAEARITPPGVALIGAGPGDPDLITVRGRRLLARADVVLADRLAPRELLDELGSHVTVIDAAKVPYGRAMAQEEINTQLIEHAKAGRFVVRLKGGDPYVFGRGFEEVLACVAAGVPVTVVPGVTSAISVPAAAGIPVTHRGLTQEFVVVSGHVAPGDPRSLVDWPALGRLRGTLVLLMAVERIGVFADALITHGRPPDTPVAVIASGTLQGQRVVHCTLVDAAVASAGIRPPAIVVVGSVAGLVSE
ncbi:MAG: uroporphyrinogen-III C-methyltransferase [Pseudonocardiales bacterium]|nr:uroporphyrinogen-III C-methyltransferase [Pseudonocardiales bacterium]MBV9029494.1 uroporphyrinogen-III C-methyltransferase [Pseudonocardiales bacterium]MBW0008963.1 uroporphyrinogen-III C-methyltransferase [Pseudonocardiales bacterium]